MATAISGMLLDLLLAGAYEGALQPAWSWVLFAPNSKL